MKYKAGDTVRIRSKEWIDAQEKNANGYILGPPHASYYMSGPMQDLASKTAKIFSVRYDYYRLDIDEIDETNSFWEDWMFDPDYKSDGPLTAKDAVIAMVRDGEHLFDRDGREFYWDDDSRIFMNITDVVRGFHREYRANESSFPLPNLCRRLKKRTRPMSRWEVLDWANSEASRGWVVRLEGSGIWNTPQFFNYDLDSYRYQRARLLPDLSGVDKSTIQGFEVEE
ncbi:MAG: hypothetical protein LBG22_09595 [Treponema sp.]|jgi:hypothetical protein|nr:hypothetical protein [Treponema sp.]